MTRFLRHPGRSHTDPAILAAAATNVLHAVNTIASDLGLDDQEDEDAEAIDRGPANRAGPRPRVLGRTDPSAT